jgi:hypothetical protein
VCVTIIIDPCGESTGDLLQNRHISHCWLYVYIQIYPKIRHYFTPKTRQKARYSRAGKCPFWDFENHLKKYLVENISYIPFFVGDVKPLEHLPGPVNGMIVRITINYHIPMYPKKY